VYAEGYDKKKLRSKVGMSFQYPEHQLFEVTVLKDVCFGPMNMGLSEEEAIAEAKKALEAVGLAEKYYEKSPFELSGGQKRRVAIAGVLAMNPEYFILDEPTAGLDPVGRDRILELIYQLHKERNMTIILVSHSMEDVAEYADRLLVMNKGHLMFDDKPVNVFRHKEELKEMGLSAPETSYLMEDLQKKGFSVDLDAITVDEAVESICLALQEKKNGQKSEEKRV
jgi:energy-coupling factor transport system ATP-binding protein